MWGANAAHYGEPAVVPRPERGGVNHCLEARGNLPNDLYAQPP